MISWSKEARRIIFRCSDQDVIRVPAYKIRVLLKGEVKIPALFEVLPGETLQNVLDFSGGFTDRGIYRTYQG